MFAAMGPARCRRAAGLWVAPLVVCLGAAACSPNLSIEPPDSALQGSTVPPSPVSEDLRYTTVQPDGERRTFDSLAALEATLPFEVVEPAFLPAGYTRTGATAMLPPAHFGETGRRRNTRVLISYGPDAEARGGIMLTENLHEPGMSTSIGDPGAETVPIGQTQGELLQRTVDGREIIALVWTGCGIQFNLTVPPTLAMDRSTALQIAESTVMRC